MTVSHVLNGCEVAERPSPNFGARRGGALPDIIVLHYTAMPSTEAALERLCDPASEVSAHYLVSEAGRVWRLVAEADRAWHAGAGRWAGCTDINSRSIGIEMANAGPAGGFPPYPEPQMLALERLIDGIRSRWIIPVQRVIGHSDMAPGRKADPGPKFDWRRLARGGCAVWAEPEADCPGGWEAFAKAAHAVGYAAVRGDWAPVLEAVRLRFRPSARGGAPVPEPEDVSVLRAWQMARR